MTTLEQFSALVAHCHNGGPPVEAKAAHYGEWHEYAAALIDAHEQAGAAGVDRVWRAFCADLPELESIYKSRKTYSVADLEELLPNTEWLWSGWLPLGYLSMLVAESGQGKSWLTLQLVGSILTGKPWPDGTPCQAAGYVVWADTEASQALLVERAQKLNLPREKIRLPSLDDEPITDLALDTDAGWGELLYQIDRFNPPLVVIDSLSGSHKGDENSAEMREILSKLARLARDKHIAVLATHHLRKANLTDQAGKIDLSRIRGSSTIAQFARVIFAIDRPDAQYRPDSVRLYVIKSNLGKQPEPIGYEVTEDGLQFGDAPEAPRVETQLDKAIDLLLTLLGKGPVKVTEIHEEADGAAISKGTLKRAKEHMSIVAFKQGRRWFWSLPSKQFQETQGTQGTQEAHDSGAGNA